MPIGLSYYGTYPLNEFLRVAAYAEGVGFDTVWLAEEFIYRDPMILAASLLSATERVKVIPGPVSPYFKHPVAIARETLTLAEISDGRLALQVGVGDINGLKLMGIDPTRPLSTTKEAISVIQGLLSGDIISINNGIWNMTGIKMVLGGKYNIPIYMAAMGSKMLRLARETADGTVLSHMTSLKYIKQSIESVQNLPGVDQSSNHEFIKFFAVSVSNDRRSAYDQIRAQVAHWLGVPFPQPVHIADWKINNLGIDHMAIYKAIQRHDIDKACMLVNDKVMTTLTVNGTPKDFSERLQQYLDAGVTYPVINPFGDFKAKINTIKLASEIFGG